MIFKENKKETQGILLVLSTILMIFVLGFQKDFTIVIYGFFMLSFLLLFSSTKNLYLLFIIVFLSNGFIPRESYMFGIIGVHQVVTAITFISLFFIDKKKEEESNQFVELSNKIIWFIFLFTSISIIRNAYFNLFGTSYYDALFRIINFLVMVITFTKITKRIGGNIDNMYSVVSNVILFFSLTSILSVYFVEFNFYTKPEMSEFGERFYGFIGNGDSNTLSIILVIGIAYILLHSKNQNIKIISIFNILLSIVALGYTGSRNGLISLIIVLIIYFFSKKQIKHIIRNSIFVILVSLFSFMSLTHNIERLAITGNEQTYIEGSTSNRIGKWVFYLNYFKEQPHSLVIGGTKELKVTWNDNFQVAHNFFIQIVYGSGILMLIYFLYLLYGNVKLNKYANGNVFLILIPMILGIVFVSDYGAVLFYALCLSATNVNSTS